MIYAPNFDLEWLTHGFGERDDKYPEPLTTVKQIHSALVVDGDADLPPGSEGDALLSHRAGNTVAVKTADCVPILLVDVETRAVAAVHAGWRGSAAAIVTTTVAAMTQHFGTDPANLRAAIGPSIRECCYEVSADVARQFGPYASEWASAERSLCIDLPRVNRIQLEAAGVLNVWTAGICSKCSGERFWSFRREGDQAGRMYSFVGQKHAI